MDDVQGTQGGARVRVPPPAVFLVGIGAGLATDRWLSPLRLPLGLATRLVAGGLVIAAGLVLGLWAIGFFRRTGQDPAPWKPSPTLILHGPYTFTRNPMYVGMTALTLGVGLCTASLWILLLAPLALLVVHVTAVRPEERYLLARFGADYERFRASTRRYL